MCEPLGNKALVLNKDRGPDVSMSSQVWLSPDVLAKVLAVKGFEKLCEGKKEELRRPLTLRTIKSNLIMERHCVCVCV